MDINEAQEELAVFLRNQDILTTSNRGVTTTTEEFNGDGSETVFTLSNTNVKNVRSVTVGGTSKSLGTDYSVNYDNAKVTFTTAPGSGTNNVDIQYDYGTDKIYTDLPRTDLSLSSYPRISVGLIAGDSREVGTNGDLVLSNYVMSVRALSDTREKVDNILQDIKTAIHNNKKTFYNFDLISQISLSPVNPEENRHNKILSRTADFKIYTEEE